MMMIFMRVEVWSVLVIFYKYEKCPKPVTLRSITQFERFTVRGFLADEYAAYIGGINSISEHLFK